MVNVPAPGAPVSHGNEEEHRRLIAQRANGCLPKTGGEGMLGPLKLQPVAKANLAAAADHAAALVYVTDEAGGAVPAFSDGTNWRRVTDRAIVS